MLRCEAGDERHFARQQMHRAHVVGLDHEAAVGGDPAQRFQVGLGFDQRLRRQHDFLAGGGEPLREFEPVGKAQLVAPRANDFAEVDDVDRRRRGRVVELEHALARPVVKHRSQRELHVISFPWPVIGAERLLLAFGDLAQRIVPRRLTA